MNLEREIERAAIHPGGRSLKLAEDHAVSATDTVKPRTESEFLFHKNRSAQNRRKTFQTEPAIALRPDLKSEVLSGDLFAQIANINIDDILSA